jgi:hypothetical protein
MHFHTCTFMQEYLWRYTSVLVQWSGATQATALKQAGDECVQIRISRAMGSMDLCVTTSAYAGRNLTRIKKRVQLEGLRCV